MCALIHPSKELFDFLKKDIMEKILQSPKSLFLQEVPILFTLLKRLKYIPQSLLSPVLSELRKHQPLSACKKRAMRMVYLCQMLEIYVITNMNYHISLSYLWFVTVQITLLTGNQKAVQSLAANTQHYCLGYSPFSATMVIYTVILW